MRNRVAKLLLVVLSVALAPLPASAQDYPSRPIKLLIPASPGGAVDAIARPVAEALRAELGQPVVLEHRPGGDGMVGLMAVISSKPDGYTLVLTSSTISSTGLFSKSVPYDPTRDFTPIVRATRAPIGLVVIPSLPIATMKDLVEYANKQSGGLPYGAVGMTGPQRFAGELLKQNAGINLVHVPYRGGAQLLTDLLAGAVPSAFLSLAAVAPSLEAGTIRMLGLIEAQRTRIAPQIPTIAENGLPGFGIPDTWFGFLGPADLPQPIVQRLNAAINKALADPEIVAMLEKTGNEIVGGTAEQMAEAMREDSEIYRKIADGAGIKPE